MCIAIPGKIVSIEGTRALVSIEGLEREADVRLVPDAKIGDYVIIHAGFAIQKYDEEEAQKTLELFRELFNEQGK